MLKLIVFTCKDRRRYSRERARSTSMNYIEISMIRVLLMFSPANLKENAIDRGGGALKISERTVCARGRCFRQHLPQRIPFLCPRPRLFDVGHVLIGNFPMFFLIFSLTFGEFLADLERLVVGCINANFC